MISIYQSFAELHLQLATITEYSRFFQYDQLNRLVVAESFPFIFRNTNMMRFWRDISSTEYFTYDPNGNITNVTRNGIRSTGSSGSMDLLTYQYTPNTNRLTRVKDTRAANLFDTDIDDQPINNYSYNAIGNLIRDSSEGITKIAWTVYGKIDSIYKSNGTIISYRYDAGGNRILKKVNNAETIYVRDASGNLMSTYTNDSIGLWQKEIHLYGSSRLGIYNLAVNLTNPVGVPFITVGNQNGKKYIFTRGQKFFETSIQKLKIVLLLRSQNKSLIRE